MRMIWIRSKCSCTLEAYLSGNISRVERRTDGLESELWDSEGQKLSGPALVGFVVSEIKSRIGA